MAVAPSPWAQAGPVKVHRQALETLALQEFGEDESVLKIRLPPLLLLLASQHPRGKYHHELVYAVVSDHPICPAADSHVAASVIHP